MNSFVFQGVYGDMSINGDAAVDTGTVDRLSLPWCFWLFRRCPDGVRTNLTSQNTFLKCWEVCTTGIVALITKVSSFSWSVHRSGPNGARCATEAPLITCNGANDMRRYLNTILCLSDISFLLAWRVLHFCLHFQKLESCTTLVDIQLSITQITGRGEQKCEDIKHSF